MRNIAISFFVVLGLLSGCSKSENKDEKKELPPQPYQYIVAKSGPAENWTQYPARLEGIQNVEIRPKIDGFVEKIYVDEGSSVNQGQLLFLLRNPQYEQAVLAAQATVNSARAAVANAQMQVTKTKPLVDKKIISAYELQAAELALQAAKASLAESQAQLANAQVNQGYTKLYSPVSGVVGTLPYKTGSYISANTAQPLTTVSNISKIFAYFSINEKQQLEFFKHAPGASIEEKIKNSPLVDLILADGTKYNQKGKIESISGLVDPNTGSFSIRATFPNPNGILRSGYSATIQLANNLENVIIIPQAATYELQGKVFVYVIGTDNKVKSVEIKVEDMPDGLTYAVTSGLKDGDKVVVEGVGLLKDGTVVIPKETTLQNAINKK
ncbi:efflux RND transporter periplasmic adaptor subunit [Chryseobacterium sp. SC28]|uniref:efflux RND transporter periplasmic adaptor subunit n=1 Tax=Chryseobacterium sp. SC28 TaxID=2268028 RepID=UPI000F650169|nr:efflux RND transporter periplasmic adaptor subunit [Chryseobacterium sp. SC28]RRQ45527.1 efflux RND transporter periplasmic adaptor subunit [Chryseobacterium sp. SC28]